MTKLTSLTLALCASLAITASASVLAHADHSANVIEERQKAFRVMGKSMRAMGKMLKSGEIDKAEVEQKVKAIKIQALKLPGWFEQELSNKTHETEALPAIWSNKADFADKVKALQNATTDIEAMMQQENFELKAAMLKLKRTCGSCHDKYKAD